MRRPSWEDVEQIVRLVRAQPSTGGLAQTLGELDESVSRLIPATASLFVPVRGTQPSLDQLREWALAPAFSRRYAPEWIESYQHFAELDRWSPSTVANPGRLTNPRDLYTPDEIRTSPYWREFVAGTGLDTGRGVYLPTHAGGGVAFNLFRVKRAGDFTPGEERILDLLIPDMTRLLRAALYQDRLRQVEQAGSESRLAIITVGDRGEVLAASAAAMGLLGEAGWTPDEVSQVLCSQHVPDTLKLRTRFGSWLELVLVQLRDGTRLITIAEIHAGSEASFAASVQHLGLGKRQAEVARLTCDGYSNSEIAYRMRISPETVKRHLAVIYGKAGVSSRPELVKRMFGVPRADGST